MTEFELFRGEIGLPEMQLPEVPEACAFCPPLCTKDYARAAEELHRFLEPDEHGRKILSVMLRAALIAREKYKKKGIPDEIFLSTMGFFSRCVREYRASYGVYGFDTWWWAGRQLSLRLFRLGALEFELVRGEAGNYVSVHIPSDADLSDESVDRSFASARRFLREFYPEFAEREFRCASWMMSPALKTLLPPGSRILRFAARFELKEFSEESEDYKRWVFKNPNLAPEEFPEDTSLQRNMKAFVLSGGKVGTGISRLCAEKMPCE